MLHFLKQLELLHTITRQMCFDSHSERAGKIQSMWITHDAARSCGFWTLMENGLQSHAEPFRRSWCLPRFVVITGSHVRWLKIEPHSGAIIWYVILGPGPCCVWYFQDLWVVAVIVNDDVSGIAVFLSVMSEVLVCSAIVPDWVKQRTISMLTLVLMIRRLEDR